MVKRNGAGVLNDLRYSGSHPIYGLRFRPLRGLPALFVTRSWGLRPRLNAVVRFADFLPW